jgi:hypothetical protein
VRASFLATTGSIKVAAAEIAVTKKQKTARPVRLYWLPFWRSKKVKAVNHSDSRYGIGFVIFKILMIFISIIKNNFY